MNFAFTPASPTSVLAFVGILAAVAVAVVAGVLVAGHRLGDARQANWRALKVAVGLVVWLGLISGFVGSGALTGDPVPGVPVFFAACNLAGVLLALSPLGALMARGLPLAVLVGFQAFRLPLELVLHAWGEGGTMPMTMTWEGQNLDVIAGVIALVSCPFANRSRGVAWAANIVGFVLLLNVMRVAVMSAPLPFSWPLEQPLLLASYLPYALIIPVCVAGALAGHIILTRKLLTGH